MKQKILFSLFFLTFYFCFPILTKATVVEVTVTITSFTVPERSSFSLRYDRPSSEANVGGARITIEDKNSRVVGAGTLKNASGGDQNVLIENNSTTIAFPYDSTLDPYGIFVDVKVTAQGANILCTAACNPIAASSGWWYTQDLYFQNSYNPDGSVKQYSNNGGCTSPSCSSATSNIKRLALAIEDEDVVHRYDIDYDTTYNYWRTPAGTIDY